MLEPAMIYVTDPFLSWTLRVLLWNMYAPKHFAAACVFFFGSHFVFPIPFSNTGKLSKRNWSSFDRFSCRNANVIPQR